MTISARTVQADHSWFGKDYSSFTCRLTHGSTDFAVWLKHMAKKTPGWLVSPARKTERVPEELDRSGEKWGSTSLTLLSATMCRGLATGRTLKQIRASPSPRRGYRSARRARNRTRLSS